MEPISSADTLIILLRQKLRERARVSGRGKAVVSDPVANAPQTSGLQALAALEGVDEHLLRRALVQNLLAEQFGDQMLNDAQFQQVIGRVTEAIEEDPDASSLIDQVLSELRTS